MSNLKLTVINNHIREWGGCTRCEIGVVAHSHVFYRGKVPCDLLFIGEAPGKTEDMVGSPFVGRAGKLLEYWLVMADVRSFAITNIVCCRPCDWAGGPNRPPTEEEKKNCEPRLVDFITAIAMPVALITLGRHAADWRSNSAFYQKKNLELPHPAYILRQGGDTSKASDDAIVKLKEFKRTVLQ